MHTLLMSQAHSSLFCRPLVVAHLAEWPWQYLGGDYWSRVVLSPSRKPWASEKSCGLVSWLTNRKHRTWKVKQDVLNYLLGGPSEWKICWDCHASWAQGGDQLLSLHNPPLAIWLSLITRNILGDILSGLVKWLWGTSIWGSPGHWRLVFTFYTHVDGGCNTFRVYVCGMPHHC